jgi:molybdopterin-guanine dinucleotide biosynthesis protein A
MSSNEVTESKHLLGLVLAGGRSTRMKKDKGLIEFYGKPQREYIFDLLSKFCFKVFTSCKKDNDIPISLNPVPDQFNIESPLNGILTAFHNYSNVAWLTVPVDMPLIDAGVIGYLISQRSQNHLATCFFDSEGKNPEPLFTIWERTAFEPLLKFYTSGKISPRDFLKQSPVKMIKIPDPQILVNINSVEELQHFKITHSSL